MRPLILLTCNTLSETQKVCEADTTVARRHGLLVSYINSVVQAGGAPLLLPLTADADAVEAAVAAAAGLLLTGGGDVAASLYGMADHATMSGIDAHRDRTEQLAIAAARPKRLPILGICRGIQIVNVLAGGTLVQDIPSQASAVNHQRPHPIRTKEGSLIARLWGANLEVNSTHHQAAGNVGDGLSPTAWASDGVIECLESADDYPLLAVQSHPERLSHCDARFLAVFQWLIAKAR